MKLYRSILTLLWVCAAAANQAQGQSSTSTDWTVTERGPHHAVHEREQIVDLGGGRVERVDQRYVELATGLNYLEDGQWKESREEFQVLSDGYAVAAQGQHKVIVSPILNDANGAVDMETPDGKRMRSTILGLALRDRVTGQQLLVAETVETVGKRIAPNQILFENCFDGVAADVRLTDERGGFHQDVILREKFDPVWLEQNGFNPATTRLEIWTEFFEAPTPKVRRRVVSSVDDPTLRAMLAEPDVLEDDLDFGVMKMRMGRAYAKPIGGRSDRTARMPKRWLTLDGRTFLVESISLSDLEPLLSALTPDKMFNGGKDKEVRFAGLKPPRPVLTHPGTNSILTAALRSRDRSDGVVLDYQTVQSQSNYTFYANLTYYVTGPVQLGETTVFEGNTVIKFAQNVGAKLVISGPSQFRTDIYRPVIFTAKDDRSLGESYSFGSGNPTGYYAQTALEFTYDGETRVENARFSYATNGVFANGTSLPSASLSLVNVQFVNCDTAIYAADCPVWMGNVLAYKVDTFAEIENSDVATEHLTLDDCNSLAYASGEGSNTLSLLNSLLVDVGDTTPAYIALTTNYTEEATGGTNVFQTVWRGAHYLLDDTYRDAGTTNIDAVLLASLSKLTTYAPAIYHNQTFTNEQAFTAEVPRDTDAPDLGYHYAPIDHTFGGCHANENISFAAGTVAGWYRTTSGWYHAGHGIHMADQKIASFNGEFGNPAYWVRTTVAQEGWDGAYQLHGPGGITGWADQYQQDIGLSPEVHLRWTVLSQFPAETGYFRDDWGYLIVRAKDCQFYSGSAGFYINSYYFTNCCFFRTALAEVTGYPGNKFILRNCSLTGYYLNLSMYHTPIPVSVKDSMVDSTALTISNYGANTNYSQYNYNAFRSGQPRFPIGGANDVVVTNFDWQSGPLGDYYLPTTGTNLARLINAGSTTADTVGLYHYTTTTNQVKETNSPVDIGYHYLAVDGDGEPIDTDGDDIPDYLEDANGNGAVDSGETDWEDAGDLGLKVWITRPRSGSIIP